MQPNPITTQESSAPILDADFGQTTATVSSAQTPFNDDNILIFHREFTTRDYALPDLASTSISRLLHPRVLYAARPAHRRAFYNYSKRCLDIICSLTLLLLALPLFACIAVLIKTTSRGPIFFAHRRLGRHGKEFGCLKFRTMVADAEDRLQQDAHLQRKFEESFKLKEDPRVTRVGAFLRKTSLDELPQLLHVLWGEMSLIGPRPIVERELSKYSIYGKKLLSLKPGLSGMWQVCGRSDTTYPQRVMMDMHYIDHRCLSLDLKLLLCTVVAVVKKSGAC
jgi:lipopolysaccharide/colanic/teichoic acid biosynthesis glycosyltransferase